MNLLYGIALVATPIAIVVFTPRIAAVVFFNISYLTRDERVELATPQAVIAMFLIWLPFLVIESRIQLLGMFQARFYAEKHVDPGATSESLRQFLTFGTIWVCLVLSPIVFVTGRFWATWARQYGLPLSAVPFVFGWCGMAVICFFRLTGSLDDLDNEMLLWPTVLVTCFAVFTTSTDAAPIGILAGSALYAWISSVHVSELLPNHLPPHGAIVAITPWYVFFALCGIQSIILRTTKLASAGAGEER